jgi:hypothetical protein
MKGSVCLSAFTTVCSTSPDLDSCRCDSSIRAVSRRQMIDPQTTELQEHQEATIQIMTDELAADMQKLSSTDAEAKRK